MSRLYIKSESQAQAVVDELYRSIENRIAASPPGLCPVDMALNFLNLCHAQTCGKCVPCRVGLGQLSSMLQRVLDGNATENTLQLIEDTAQVVVDTTDCAIGTQAARLVLMGACQESPLPGRAEKPGTLRGAVPGGGRRPRLYRPDPRGALCRRSAPHPEGQPLPHGVCLYL